MKLHDLKINVGAKRPRKRIGRGDGSGTGGTAGRGEKGQKSRSGAKIRPYFEGGQIPLFRRLPKRGFNSKNHKFYNVINLGSLDVNFQAGEEVNAASLKAKGLCGNVKRELKILGYGDLTKALTVKANKFSATAKSKIEASGGTCEIV